MVPFHGVGSSKEDRKATGAFVVLAKISLQRAIVQEDYVERMRSCGTFDGRFLTDQIRKKWGDPCVWYYGRHNKEHW